MATSIGQKAALVPCAVVVPDRDPAGRPRRGVSLAAVRSPAGRTPGARWPCGPSPCFPSLPRSSWARRSTMACGTCSSSIPCSSSWRPAGGQDCSAPRALRGGGGSRLRAGGGHREHADVRRPVPPESGRVLQRAGWRSARGVRALRHGLLGQLRAAGRSVGRGDGAVVRRHGCDVGQPVASRPARRRALPRGLLHPPGAERHYLHVRWRAVRSTGSGSSPRGRRCTRCARRRGRAVHRDPGPPTASSRRCDPARFRGRRIRQASPP